MPFFGGGFHGGHERQITGKYRQMRATLRAVYEGYLNTEDGL